MPDNDPNQQPPRNGENGNRPPGPGGNNGGGPGGRPPVRGMRGMFSWVLVVALALVLLIMLQRSMDTAKKISITEFETYMRNGDVDTLIAKERSVTGELRTPFPDTESKEFRFAYEVAGDMDAFRKWIDELRPATAEVRFEYQPENNLFLQLLIGMLPWLLIFGLIWFFLFRQLRQAGGGPGMLGNFGRSKHRMLTKELTNVTFTDVAGVEEAKDEVAELVEFLKNPKRFQRLGGRIPRGVLLVGEPGVGKTMLAKAIAGEADVPFFSISGSDFVEMFVGVGASRVRDLFRQAKENSPCIVFLDEIDAVGRRRGMGYSGGGHDEREQTLNAILVEMDGFDTNDQVIVVAATNRADVLDPALIRPGRFDRQVVVPLPDVKGRFEILRVHAKKVKMAAPIDPKLHRIARGTPMFSGADLAAIINESALLATLAGKDSIDLDDLEEARDKVRWGRAKRSRVIDDRERELTAYHEAGHALVQSLLEHADPVHKVSIIPRGQYGGATFSLPEKDRMTYNRSYIEATLRVMCAGRLAEEILGEDANSGASGDIMQATNLAKRMVLDWGMSERLGFVNYARDERFADMPGGREHSEKTAEIVDAEIRRIIDEAYADTRKLMQAHREQLEGIATALMKYETIDGEEVKRIIAGESIDRPTVADLIEAEQSRRPSPPMARPVNQPPDEEESSGPLPSPA
jgi:cell division protease FtsH